jgi:hypothetical protein
MRLSDSAPARDITGSLQRSQLMSQGHILEDDYLVSAARQGDRAEEQQQQFEHGLIVT